VKKLNKTQTKTYVLALGNKTYVSKRVVQMVFITQIREQNANQNARFGTWQQNAFSVFTSLEGRSSSVPAFRTPKCFAKQKQTHSMWVISLNLVD